MVLAGGIGHRRLLRPTPGILSCRGGAVFAGVPSTSHHKRGVAALGMRKIDLQS